MEGSVKERLTGALIVVSVLVIVASEMFSGPGANSAGNVAAQEPAEAGPPVRTYSVTLDNAGQPAQAEPAAPTIEPSLPEPPAETPASTPATVAVSPAIAAAPEVKEAAPVVANAAKPASAPAAAAGGEWWLQVGIFASRDNAERLAKKLRTAGFSVDLEKYTAGGKDMLRVRAGPVRDRAEALALQARLAAAGNTSHLLSP